MVGEGLRVKAGWFRSVGLRTTLDVLHVRVKHPTIVVAVGADSLTGTTFSWHTSPWILALDGEAREEVFARVL